MGFNLDDYELVETRLARFHEDHPKNRVITSVEHYEGDFVVILAKLYDDRDDAVPSATGIAEERRGDGHVNKNCHVENCETSAIGRALANRGYAPKGKRPSREEMQKAACKPVGNGDPLKAKMQKLGIDKPLYEQIKHESKAKGRDAHKLILESDHDDGKALLADIKNMRVLD